MSDEAAEAEESPQNTAGKGGGLVTMLLTAVLAGVFGAVGAVAIQHSPLGQAPTAAATAAEPVAEDGTPSEPTETPEDFQARLLSIEPIVVNIAGSGVGRFLKVTVEVETDSVAARDELQIRLPQVKDSIITLMSSKRIADVADFEGKVLLKEDLRDRLNELLTTGSVESVLLTEFVVQ